MKRTIILLAIACMAVALFSGCGTKVKNVPNSVAEVNGEKINSKEYFTELSKRAGKDVLAQIIEKKILDQWAKEEKVEPTKEQIDSQLARLKREGVYDEQVKLIGDDGIMSEITSLQTRVNIAKKLNSPSEEEIKKAYESMKANYVHGARKRIAIIMNPDKAKVDEAAKLIKDGKDFDAASAVVPSGQFSQGGPVKAWVNDDQKGIPKPLADAIKNTKIGEVSDVVEFSVKGQPPQYFLLKIVMEQGKADLKFDDVKNEIEDMVAMQKSQMDPAFAEKLNEKKKDAKIKVEIKGFEDVVTKVQNPAPPAPQMMQQGPPPSRR